MKSLHCAVSLGLTHSLLETLPSMFRLTPRCVRFAIEIALLIGVGCGSGQTGDSGLAINNPPTSNGVSAGSTTGGNVAGPSTVTGSTSAGNSATGNTTTNTSGAGTAMDAGVVSIPIDTTAPSEASGTAPSGGGSEVSTSLTGPFYDLYQGESEQDAVRFNSVSEMASASNVIAIGRFVGFGLSRQVPGSVSNPPVTYAAAEFSVEQYAKGQDTGEPITLEFVSSSDNISLIAAALPTERMLVFLSQKTGADEVGLYRLVNSDGLFVEVQDGIARPFALAESVALDAELQGAETLEQVVSLLSASPAAGGASSAAP